MDLTLFVKQLAGKPGPLVKHVLECNDNLCDNINCTLTKNKFNHFLSCNDPYCMLCYCARVIELQTDRDKKYDKLIIRFKNALEQYSKSLEELKRRVSQRLPINTTKIVFMERQKEFANEQLAIYKVWVDFHNKNVPKEHEIKVFEIKQFEIEILEEDPEVFLESESKLFFDQQFPEEGMQIEMSDEIEEPWEIRHVATKEDIKRRKIDLHPNVVKYISYGCQEWISEIIDKSIQVARHCGKNIIEPNHISFVLNNNKDLSFFLKDV